MVKGYEVVIGLETHAELNTESKIYCDCKNQFGLEVNSQVCPICMGMPGTLPTLNEKVVDYAIRMGHALNCEINRVCKQDRKNYFYPDLPKAYQISQAEVPLCGKGYVDILVDGEERRIGITRIHIEEDAGKLLHSDKFHGVSLVDLNRCGVPLIEIVSEPDMRSSQEAKVYLETLKSILQYLGICDCKMQEGSIRCDVNVSVHKPGEPFGTRSEMKNVNSFSAAVRGIDYEVERQIAVLEAGGKVEQETRRWDDEKGMSIPMRSKEDAQDYRYFPEPDLLTIVVEQERVDELKKSIPELPNVKILRYVKKFGLNIKDATFIAESVSLAKLFDDCMAKDKFPAKCYTTWILGDLVKYMNATGKTLEDTKLTADNLTDLVAAIEAKTISNAGGKKVFAVLLEEDKKVSDIIEEQGLAQVSDDSALEKIADEVLAANEKSVNDYKGGKTNALGYLVGQCMKASKGKANPGKMKEIILVKYGEIALKGLNKSTFEDMLQKNIKRRLKKLGTFGFYRRQSTIYITPPEEADIDEVINRLQKIFGISAIQRCAVFPKDFSVIAEHAPEYLREALEGAKTFKVESKRSDKAFPMKTPEIQQELGAVILDAFPHIGVDVHEPEVTVRLEIRDNGAYLSALRIPGAGGMPVGSSGKSAHA